MPATLQTCYERPSHTAVEIIFWQNTYYFLFFLRWSIIIIFHYGRIIIIIITITVFCVFNFIITRRGFRLPTTMTATKVRHTHTSTSFIHAKGTSKGCGGMLYAILALDLVYLIWCLIDFNRVFLYKMLKNNYFFFLTHETGNVIWAHKVFFSHFFFSTELHYILWSRLIFSLFLYQLDDRASFASVLFLCYLHCVYNGLIIVACIVDSYILYAFSLFFFVLWYVFLEASFFV